jgi:hypothetical protein
MKLPNAEQARVDIHKLRDYCLNPNHPEGRHKARVFKAALGIGRDDADWLGNAILTAVRVTDVVSSEHTRYGWRYDLDIELSRDSRSATIRTGWIVRHTDNLPRLATCFVR